MEFVIKVQILDKTVFHFLFMPLENARIHLYHPNM